MRGNVETNLSDMKISQVRQKLSRGEMVLTAKVNFWTPDVIELICSHGYDGIWYCLEHNKLNPETVTAAIRATRLSGVDAIMRVKPSNHSDVLWLLETGARGLMLPRVRDVTEVENLVEMMKFPPMGRRGYDGVQPESNFAQVTPADYMESANRESFLVVQIEEPEIVPHIDAVAATPGVDVLFVGPSDLTLSMGKFGQTGDPEILEIMQKVADACKRHGKTAGIPCAPEDVPKYHEMGFRYFNVISDFRMISDGLKQVGQRMKNVGFPFGG